MLPVHPPDPWFRHRIPTLPNIKVNVAQRTIIFTVKRLVALALTFAVSAGHADGRLRTLLILHTNDIHGHVADAPRFAAHFHDRKTNRDDVLIVDAGDAITGTPLSAMFEGRPIFEIMSAMGYDAAALGNHEFDHGWRRVAAFKEAADFPLLAANVRAPDGSLIADAGWTVLEVNGIDVGIVGVVNEHSARMIIPEGNEGVVFEPVLETLRRIVPEVRRRADIVILLSHVGHEEELALAREVDGIDVIVGGHSHTLLEEPAWSGRTIVTQAHYGLRQLGWLYLRVDTRDKRMYFIDGGFTPAADQPPPLASVADLVARHEARVGTTLDHPLSRTGRHHDRDEVRRWMMETLRRRADADFGFYNRGGVRADIEAGEVTVRDLWLVEPFGRNLVTMRLPGSALREMMLGEEDEVPSGLDDSATYTVATDAFVAGRAVDRDAIDDLGVRVRDVLIEAIQKEGLP